jgi:hypothetical protein
MNAASVSSDGSTVRAILRARSTTACLATNGAATGAHLWWRVKADRTLPHCYSPHICRRRAQ